MAAVMSRSPRWVISPFDSAEHLRTDAQPSGVLTARCGHRLPTDAAGEHPRPVLRTV
jgi:hypothetical protein